MVIAGDGCPQGEHLQLLPAGQRLVIPGVAVALLVVGSPRPHRRERARRQVAPGQLAEPGDLPGQDAAGVADGGRRLGGLPGRASPSLAITA